MQKILRDSLIITSISVLIMLALPVLNYIPIIRDFAASISDFSITDIGMKAVQEEMFQSADTNIVLVNIKNSSISTIESAINIAKSANAKVIGVNLEGISEQDDKNFLINEFNADNHIIFGDENNMIMGKNANKSAHNNTINPNRKHSTTRYYSKAYISDSQSYIPKILMLASDNKVNQYRQLLDRNIDKEVINYRGNYKKYYYYSAGDLEMAEIDSNSFAGKIVLLGEIETLPNRGNLRNLYFTPLNENPSGRSIPDMSKTEIEANILSMVMNLDYIDQTPTYFIVIISILGVFANCLIFYLIIDWNAIAYEIFSLALFLIESFALVLITIHAKHNLHYELNLSLLLLSWAIGLLCFEVYNESFKPILKLILDKRRK